MIRFSSVGRLLKAFFSYTLLSIVFISAFCLVWLDQPTNAGVMSGLFILLIIAIKFPEIESFKAFNIEVTRIKETLEDAQATLDQLKQVALSSARNQFYQLSTAGRWDAGALEPKEKLAKDLNKFLSEIGIDDSDIRESRAPYIDMIRTDLFNVMRDLVTKSFMEAVQPLLDELNAIKPRFVDGKNMYDEDRRPLQETADRMGSAQAYLTHGIPTEAHFLDVMQAEIFRDKLGDKFAIPILNVGSHLIRLYMDAKREGNLTDEGLAFLTRYGQYGLEKDKGEIRQSRYAAAAAPQAALN